VVVGILLLGAGFSAIVPLASELIAPAVYRGTIRVLQRLFYVLPCRAESFRGVRARAPGGDVGLRVVPLSAIAGELRGDRVASW